MTVKELLDLLNNLPIQSLELPIYVDNKVEEFTEFTIEPITESCDDLTIVGYILTESTQLTFKFERN
jgi:hypothetical protein